MYMDTTAWTCREQLGAPVGDAQPCQKAATVPLICMRNLVMTPGEMESAEVWKTLLALGKPNAAGERPNTLTGCLYAIYLAAHQKEARIQG